jgi:1,2-diacylglycerol 3-beta-galactosyltransferase
MKRIIFLMSDTGGGHRAAGRAIEAALDILYPDQYETFYVDVFREYTPPPMKYAPEIYPKWVKHSIKTYGWYFQFFDQLMQLPLARTTLPMLIAEEGVRKLVTDYQPDLIVVLHGAFSRFIVGARNKLKLNIPIITVITDLAKPHVAWYHPGVDRCLVPCEAAYTRGIKLGVPVDKLRIVGHPAHPKFALNKKTKHEARRQLNWAPDMPAVMVIGGGEGMGMMSEIAEAINRRALDAQLAIVCGRNETLRKEMRSITWNQQTYIYGFVNNIEVMMRAADVLITKAGPGTIAEAAISGVPMILNDAIPYQESPNVGFVVDSGAGVFEPEPEGIAAALEKWLTPGDDTLAKLAANVEKLAYPNATFDIAGEIAYQCEHPRVSWMAPSFNTKQLGLRNEI